MARKENEEFGEGNLALETQEYRKENTAYRRQNTEEIQEYKNREVENLNEMWLSHGYTVDLP